jgi:hypothetical protein
LTDTDARVKVSAMNTELAIDLLLIAAAFGFFARMTWAT